MRSAELCTPRRARRSPPEQHRCKALRARGDAVALVHQVLLGRSAQVAVAVLEHTVEGGALRTAPRCALRRHWPRRSHCALLRCSKPPGIERVGAGQREGSQAGRKAEGLALTPPIWCSLRVAWSLHIPVRPLRFIRLTHSNRQRPLLRRRALPAGSEPRRSRSAFLDTVPDSRALATLADAGQQLAAARARQAAAARRPRRTAASARRSSGSSSSHAKEQAQQSW